MGKSETSVTRVFVCTAGKDESIVQYDDGAVALGGVVASSA
jgi:hypothetical protein